MSIRTLVAVSLLAAVSMAFAGSSGSPRGGNSKAGANSVSAAGEKQAGFVDVSGNGSGTALPQYTFVTVAETTVNCKKSCSILLEATSQVQTAGADWALCLLVDGTDIECQYQGVQAGPSSYVVGNARAFAAGLGAGAHDVQLQLYSESTAGTYEYFDLDATTYLP